MMVLTQAKFPGAKKGSHPGKRSPPIQPAKPIRPLLQSIESPTLLEKERSKIALINQLFQSSDSMQREFSSYYLSSTTKSEGSYLLTSHENPSPIQPPTVSAYNTLVQDFRWDPYVESTKMVTYRETAAPICEESSDFQDSVECKKSDSRHDSSTKFSSTVVSNPRSSPSVMFKDNIMKFNNRGTMTRKMSNACCGSRTPVSCSRYTSEASVSASHVAMQDTSEKIPLNSYIIPQTYEPPQGPRKVYPPPILKKPMYHAFQSKYDKYVKLEPVLKDVDAEMGVIETPSYPVEYDSLPSTKKNYKERPGKVLYNEGIDDSVKQNFFLPMRIPVPANVTFDSSKVGIGHYYNDTEADIPHSHRSESKYHAACMESVPRRRVRDDDRKGLAASRMPRNYQNGTNQHKAPSIPKRVLASDQDIDTFIELNVPKLVVPKRKK